MSVVAPSSPTYAWLPNTETRQAAPPEKVQVVCRVRPSVEYGEHCVSITSGVGGDIVRVSGLNREFTASKAFGEESSQEDVFELLGKPSIAYLMQGFGACIFAYGQTGSGKTFTMSGTPSAPGLIPRMIGSLFDGLVNDFADFTVAAEYLEVYMEKVRDLFTPSRVRNPWDAPGPKLNIRYNGKRVQVENAKRLTFGRDASLSKEDHDMAASLSAKLLNDVECASHHRVVRGHALNAESSRSHAVLSLEVTARRPGREIASTLMLVDLAGSESIGKAQVEGIGREEAKSINKSLFSLTRCIEALANGQKVPFRDSVLTKLLTPALDGRSCCTLIAALRGDHAPESRETLKFMELAVKIAVRPKQTSSDALGAVQGQAQDLRGEIEMLKQEIEFLKRSGMDSTSLRNMVAEKEKMLQAKLELLGDLQRDIRDTEELLANVQKQLDTSKEEIQQEKAKSTRLEAENLLLLARLRDAETRKDAEQQMQKLQGQKRFNDKREAILGELAKYIQKHCLEDAMKACVRLVQLFHEDLTMRLNDDSHRASLALLDNLRILADRLENCLQIWPELQGRLLDLSFVARELDAQQKRIDSICRNKSRLAQFDWITYQAILEDMWRMSKRAVGIVVGQASTRSRTSGFQPLLQKLVSVFSESMKQWKAYSSMWNEHWQFRVCSLEDDVDKAVHTDSTNMDLHKMVSLVSVELENLFTTFSANVAEMFEKAEIAHVATIADEVQKTCVHFLRCMVENASEAQDAPVKRLSDEFQSTQVRLTDERSAFCDSMLTALHTRWSKLKDSANQDTQTLKGFVEEGLRRFQVHDLCEPDLYQRCLSKPTASFIRDVVKFVRYSSTLLKSVALGKFDWNETWTQDHPLLEMKTSFIEHICNAMSSACDNMGWEGVVPSDCSCLIINGGDGNSDAQQALLFLGQLCIVAEAVETNQPSKELDLLAQSIAIAFYVAAFSEWISSLKTKIEHLMIDRQHEMQQLLASSQNGANDTTRQLSAQREQHLENQKTWDAERLMLQENLYKAQAENQQLMSKLEAANQEWQRKGQSEAAALQDTREEVAFWRQRSDATEDRLAAVQLELEAARSRTRLRLKDAEALVKQLAFTELLLLMIREMQDSLATAEGGQEVQDLISTLENVLKVHLDALRLLAGQDPELKEKMSLMNVADFIAGKRAGKRIRVAKTYSQTQSAENEETSNLESDTSITNDNGVDEALVDLCDRLHMVLLALAEQHATVGAVRLEEERALVAYMRASLKKAWERRQNLASQILQLEAQLRKSETEGLEGISEEKPTLAELKGQSLFPEHTCDPAVFRRLATKLRASKHSPELVDLESLQPEFNKAKVLVESAGSRSLTLSVHRVRKVRNHHLEADFYEGIAECLSLSARETEPLIINNVFHGSSSRLCELISHEGFRLPHDLGSKLGPFGNAIYFSMCASAASSYSVATPGRLRSLLICDLMVGRVLVPELLHPEAIGNLCSMSLDEIRALTCPDGSKGYDSVFVAGGRSKLDEHAVYDARLALPRYIVDFDICGLGSENDPEESEEVFRLKADISELREQGGNVQVSALRTKFQLLSEVLLEFDSVSRLINIERSQEPALWNRFVDRLQQAAEDGAGLAFGLEAVMTRLERIVNPKLASQFYSCAAELFYPEEAFQLLLSATTGTDVHRVIEGGFKLTLPNDGRSEDQLYGRGVYFATSASMFLGNQPGSHRIFVCEVALGKPMMAQSARPNLDADALKRSGFDSLRAPRRSQEEGDEWVVYNAAQVRPAYLLSYDVQPKALVSQLLREVVSLEDRRRSLDEQLAAALQELEDAKRASNATRLQLDESLARQLGEEEKNLAKARKESRTQQERLDSQRAVQLQEMEKAKEEVRELQRRSEHLPTLDTPPKCPSPSVQTQSTSGSSSGTGVLSRNTSLPSLRGRR